MNTECVIIGTEHEEREGYSSSDLLQILHTLIPKVILLELDSSFFTEDHKLRQFHNDSLEDMALKPFITDHPEVDLRPFDIEGRNDFYVQHQSFDKERALFDEMNDLYNSGVLCEDARNLWDQLCSHYQRRDEFRSRGVRAINSFECDWAIIKKRCFSDLAVARIIEMTPQLHEYCAFWHVEKSFERKREYEMSRHMGRYCTEYSGFRIVVLCGLEHRGSLRLNFPFVDIDGDVELREYWEYE